MRMKLTDRGLEKYNPKTQRDEIFDKEVGGFGVRVTPKGKTFFFIRRVRGHKVRFALGKYPTTSLAAARRQAFEIIDAINKGSDPRDSLRKQAEAESDTFAHVAKRFMTEYAEGKKIPLRKNTLEGYRRSLQGDRVAKWAARSLSDISDGDVIRVIDKLEAEKHFAAARIFRDHLRKFFNWCIGKRLIRENPTRGVALASEPSDFKRDRHLAIAELRTVLEAADKQNELTRAFFWILILTGQRRSETALMKWDDVVLDGETPTWKIPAENSKNRKAHEVALSSEAVTVLSRLPKLGEFVFTSNGRTPTTNFSKMKIAIDKLAKLKTSWRIHDLRRSVATGMGELGFAPHIIEMVLNHISGEKSGVSGLYNRSRYDADCRRALAAWAQAVTAKDADNVVKLPRASTSAR